MSAYRFEQVRKAVVALVVSVVGLVALFAEFDPSTLASVVAVAVAGLNVVGVFAVRNEA